MILAVVVVFVVGILMGFPLVLTLIGATASSSASFCPFP